MVLAGTTSAHSQDAVAENGVVYVKRLDLRLNPAGSSGANARLGAGPPLPSAGDGFHETPLTTQRPSAPIEAQGGEATRVINGTPSRAGYWQSAVNLTVRRGRIDRFTGRVGQHSFNCGASVIDRQWLLTAAHCVFDARLGGARTVRWVTAYEGSRRIARGAALRVSEIHVHRRFKAVNGQLINDLALLKLEGAAQGPRQKLAAYRGAPAFLAEGNVATAVGWGSTAASQHSPSPILLEANVPIVAQEACRALYPDIGNVAFCAGYAQGGTDTCKGDSGGPLYVSGSHGEPVQAGITSFGHGCARPKVYGAYTNVGLFEQWIKERVPNADFVVPADPAKPASALAQVAGYTPGSPPAARGQLSVDLRAVACPHSKTPLRPASLRAVDRIKVGSCIKVEVTSSVSGQLAVFSRDAEGRVTQLFPNQIPVGPQAGTTVSGGIKAGHAVELPEPGDNFSFEVSPPLGRADIIAIVVPESVNLPASAYRGWMREVADLEAELAAVARQVSAVPGGLRAVGTRHYEVVE